MQSLYSTTKNQSWFLWFLRGLLILGFVILFAKMAELQIIKGDYYRNLAEGNRIKKEVLPAQRGRLHARGGEEMGGIDFAHITGYTAEATKEEVGKVDPNCTEKGPIILGQVVGRMGLNQTYNCPLTGVNGEVMYEVNALGKVIRQIGLKNPVSGTSVKTNIDFKLQKLAAKHMQGTVGAFIATDKNGEVLALYSSPSFEPEDVAGVLSNSTLPLFNRVIGGIYHPGSVFKPVVTIAGLEEGVITKDYLYNDVGFVRVESVYGNFDYTNWYFTQYGKAEGNVDAIKALARSTDTFYYKLGESLGIQKLLDWTKKFGLGSSLEIDIPGEAQSLIPTPEWKEKVKKEKWFLGNTYHYSIGQGDLAVSPASIHRANLVIASGGKLCNLKLVGDSKCVDLKINKENIEIVRQGMVSACQVGGTGSPFFDWKGEAVACKTGTAETDEEGKNHAWFTIFSPAKNPEIAITILVEKAGEGSKVAAPIARKVMDEYYENQ